jgi:GT2 family glycosyltransferase
MGASDAADLSLVILSWNTKALLRECLEAVQAGAGGLRLEIIVIDNASGDGSADMVAAAFPEVRLERNDLNRGYAGGVNQGLRLSTGRKVCILGSDTRVAPDALPRMAAFLDAHPDAGAVAPRLLNLDGSVQHACMRFPSLKTVLFWDTPLQAWFPRAKELERYQMKDWDHRGTREVDQPPGTCLMVPRHVLDRVGLMDERLWLFFNDVDWALRMRRAGYQLWYLDEATVVHHLGGSTRHYTDFAAEWHRNRIRFYRKHHHVLGTALAKAALVWVALRQCWRVRQELRGAPAWRADARQILRMAAGILRI